ncbi:MAG: hypothetical protein HGA76_11225, partial [Candidatus Firestonebacteria bacterium]|nr:hypothetical protein [Candidatus Firestonebacteria bacterium]
MTATDPKTTETHRAVIQNVAIAVFLGALVLLYAFFLTFFPGFSTGVIHSDFLLSLSLAGALVLLIKSIHPDRAKQVFFPPAVSVLLLLNAAFFPLQAGLIALPPAAFSGPAPLSGWVLSDLLTAGFVVGLLARHYFRPTPAGKVSWLLWGGELALFFLTAWFGPQLAFPGLATFINSWWGSASYYGLPAALWTLVAGLALAAWR